MKNALASSLASRVFSRARESTGICLTRLFHPRRDLWHHHFRWDGPSIVPLTDVGRTTLAVLALNHPHQLAIREALLNEGVFPLP